MRLLIVIASEFEKPLARFSHAQRDETSARGMNRRTKAADHLRRCKDAKCARRQNGDKSEEPRRRDRPMRRALSQAEMFRWGRHPPNPSLPSPEGAETSRSPRRTPVLKLRGGDNTDEPPHPSRNEPASPGRPRMPSDSQDALVPTRQGDDNNNGQEASRTTIARTRPPPAPRHHLREVSTRS